MQESDLDAFETLVIKHQKKMFNIAFRMLNNYEDACEIVQDSFFSAYKGIESFEKRSSFSTWLCYHCNEHLQKPDSADQDKVKS